MNATATTQHARQTQWSTSNYLGFLKTRMTESPLKNILLMNLSRLTGRPPLAPRPRFGICEQDKAAAGKTHLSSNTPEPSHMLGMLHEGRMLAKNSCTGSTALLQPHAFSAVMPPAVVQPRTSGGSLHKARCRYPALLTVLCSPLSTSPSHSPGSCYSGGQTL